MSMTDRPIPADLMDEQPIPAEQINLLAELALAFDGPTDDLLALAESLTPEQVAESPDPEEERVRTGATSTRQWPTLLAARLVREAPATMRFRITDRGVAEWAMRKLAEREATMAERRELARQWREEVNRWEKAELAPLETSAAFFRANLEAYMVTEREADPKVKSIKLPSGRLASSGSDKAAPAIEDQAAVLAWAEALPEKLRDGDLSPIKRTAEVQISRLAKLVTVHEVLEPREGDPEDTVLHRYVTLAIDPETGEAYPEDGFDPSDHAIPGVVAEVKPIKPRVELG